MTFVVLHERIDLLEEVKCMLFSHVHVSVQHQNGNDVGELGLKE